MKSSTFLDKESNLFLYLTIYQRTQTDKRWIIENNQSVLEWLEDITTYSYRARVEIRVKNPLQKEHKVIVSF